MENAFKFLTRRSLILKTKGD